MPAEKKQFLFRVLLLLILVALCWSLDGMLTQAPITKDARQNLRAGFNLNTWGVFSIEEPDTGPPSPDNYREPVVPAAAALFMRLHPAFTAATDFEQVASGSLCRQVKRVNLVWALLTLLGTAVLAAELTRSAVAALVSCVLVWLTFLSNPEHIDTLCTEIPTAAVMLWASLLLVRSVRADRVRLFFAAGALYGVLCLTKAVFLYLAPLAMLIVFFCCASAARLSAVRAFAFCAVFAAGIAVAAGPWMLRNYMHFGSATLAQRGGTVLYGRMLRNTMTMDEVVSALYLWGPGAYQKLVRSTFLDRSPEDFEYGGRGARLNRSSDSGFAPRDEAAERAGRPEDAISFHSQSRAERVRVIRRFASQGHANPELASDDHLQREARQWIVRHPVRHTLMSLLFAWRGIWCFYGGGIFTALNALCAAAFLGLAAYGPCAGRPRITACIALPFLMLSFNAFFSHNLSRYSAPAIPHLLLSLCVVACLFTQRCTHNDTPATRCRP
ncbi:MAG: hypothetical protein FJ119_01620 [Deltaproteobacteria bacterium]|nr:hypothetical protein [Deltaproteobacteria bacterium]